MDGFMSSSCVVAGEDGAVRAAGHREAPSSGARPAGEEAGERHAPLHAGAAHGAVPPAGAAHARSPAGPPPPAAAAQATPVAAAPEAPPILRDGQVLRGERQDRGDGHRRAGAARRGQGQAPAPRRAPRRPVLPGAVGDDGAQPEGVQRPLRRVLGGDGAEQPAARVVGGGLRGVPELHGQHRVLPRQGAVPERAAAAHRRAGAPAEPQEGDPAEGRQDAAVLVARRRGATRRRRWRTVVAVVGGPEAGRVQRVPQGRRVWVHHLRAHRGHRLQPDAVARRVRGATWPVLSPCPC